MVCYGIIWYTLQWRDMLVYDAKLSRWLALVKSSRTTAADTQEDSINVTLCDYSVHDMVQNCMLLHYT